jgi:aspartyl-tRNA(Asn)/glutamyl-tRNA(Gln) amidotransferase subunit B
MSTGSVSTRYEPVIGLEVHVQLKTRSKMFCGCRVEFGAPPNTHVCPVCLGLPGALPVANRYAVELAILAALGLNCEVRLSSAFARKNYFYPDLPKGYQITQYDQPLASGGWLETPALDGGEPKRVRIRRLHVEEDSGKSLHDRFPGRTAVDLNRAGIPLAEIVTEPDIGSPAEARALLVRLKQLLEYLDVSDCNMEEGSLRVDANLSVRPSGSAELSTKTEVKNMNSFSQLEKALEFEAARHIRLLDAGRSVEHQTMLWDPGRNQARPMRGKEEVHDYRYFPEPDLPLLVIDAGTVERMASRLPELPWAKAGRFMAEYGLPASDAEVLSASRDLADYFEAVAAAASDAKAAANWVMVEVLAVSNELGVPVQHLDLAPGRLAQLIEIVAEGTLSHGLGKQVLRRMVETGRSAEEIVEDEDLRKVGDAGQIEGWIDEAIRENPRELERYREGERKLLTFFIGQVMRRSKGKADPEQLRRALIDKLEGEDSGE